MVAVATLLSELGSGVEEDTETLFKIVVPLGVFGLTLTFNLNKIAPTLNVGTVQLTFPVPPTAGAVQLKPNSTEGEIEIKVVFAGTVVAKVTFAAALGPLLVKIIEYVMLFPATTGSGASTLLTDKSPPVGTGVGVGVGDIVGVGVGVGPAPPTVVVVVAELFDKFGSGAEEDVETLSLIIVPFGVPGLTLTINLNNAAPLAKFLVEQVMLPVPPTAGVVQLKPTSETGANETKVVFAGTEVVRTAVAATLGPLFVRTI